MTRILGIAVICAAATLILKESKSSVWQLLPLAGGACIVVYALVSLGSSVDELYKLTSGTALSEYAGTLTRAVGIGYASTLTADVCRGCGADAPASAIIMLGRAELLALCCPLIARLMTAASSLLL